MAAFLFISVLVLGILLAVLSLKPAWAGHLCVFIDQRLSSPEMLLTVSFLILMGIGTLILFSVLGPLFNYGQVVDRLKELLIWSGLLGAHCFALLYQSYGTVFQRPDFFTDGLHKILRALFIGRLSFWLRLALLLTTLVVLIPTSSISMNRAPSHDSGIFLYFGQQILKGEIPFRDLWDHKPPMIFYMDALGLFLGHGSLWGVWTLEYLALACSSLIGFSFLRRYYQILPSFLAVFFSLAGVVFMIEGGNLTEEYSLPLQWGVLILFAVSEKAGWQDRGGNRYAFMAGVLFSLALNFKQTMVGIWLALFLWFGIWALSQKKLYSWKVFAWAGAGALVTMGIIILYFASHQALAEYWRVAYVYNFLYSDASPGRRYKAFIDIWEFLTCTSPFFALALAAWVVAVILAIRHKSNFSFPVWVALIDLPIELVLISTSGKNYRHYFMTLLPVFTILAAWGMDIVFKRKRWIILGALILSAAVLYPTANALWTLWQPTSEATISETVRLIENETQPDDYVLMWGSQTVVNYLSHRLVPTRFVHQKPLFRAGFAGRPLSDELLQDLETHPPALIINTLLPSTPFIAKGGDGSCLLPDELPDGMDAVFDFICRHYDLEKIITKDRWEVYRLRQP